MAASSTPAVTTTPAVQFLGQDVQFGNTVGTVGFFGKTPIVKQTGVTVSDAAVHAALVALGLIS